MARDFRKIVAWKKADDLVVEIYRQTARSFPRDERYGLVPQLRSAAVSVAANIAEGSGRSTSADFRRFLYQAQGSLSEVEYYLHLAERLDMTDSSALEKLQGLRAEVGKTLTGLILAVSRPHASGLRTAVERSE
jgi:four helix bundle protein